jgi:alpha/beta superfamily hydrolase
MVRETVRFPAAGEDAPNLEGELWRPEGEQAVAAVVVAHPHPLRGGRMDNNVVMALGMGLQQAGIAWLRFNFRGVGRSEGEHGSGADEPSDILGALTFLAAQPGIDVGRIGLAGYSFGARMSLATVGRTGGGKAPPTGVPHIRGLLCVAPPLQEPLPTDDRPAFPFLVLVGDRDGVLAQGAERYASFLPDPKQLRVVPGTDHFWRGFEPVLVDAARDFFSEVLAVGRKAPQTT